MGLLASSVLALYAMPLAPYRLYKGLMLLLTQRKTTLALTALLPRVVLDGPVRGKYYLKTFDGVTGAPQMKDDHVFDSFDSALGAAIHEGRPYEIFDSNLNVVAASAKTVASSTEHEAGH